jgi:hypothetical protein
MGHPLDVEVIAPGPLVIIFLSEDAITKGPGPGRPGGALPLARGPESGVVLDFGMGREEPPKVSRPSRGIEEERARELLEHPAFHRHLTAVVHHGRGAQRLDFPPDSV